MERRLRLATRWRFRSYSCMWMYRVYCYGSQNKISYLQAIKRKSERKSESPLAVVRCGRIDAQILLHFSVSLASFARLNHFRSFFGYFTNRIKNWFSNGFWYSFQWKPEDLTFGLTPCEKLDNIICGQVKEMFTILFLLNTLCACAM